MQRRVRTAAAATIAMTAALGTATAAAQAQPAQSAKGYFSSSKITAEFDAQRPADSPATAATGTFKGRMVGPNAFGQKTIAYIKGPVTCLDVRGGKVGLFYPIDESTIPLLGMSRAAGVYVSFTYSGNEVSKIAFVPLPVNHMSSCAPTGGVLPADEGPVTVTS